MLGGQVQTARLGLLTPLHRGLNLAVRSFQRHPFLVRSLAAWAAGPACWPELGGQRLHWRRGAPADGAASPITLACARGGA